jgi:hypothetical protein
MKKILVVLLVLAVATGVFAQEGEWSLSGTAQFGAIVDFDPMPSVDGYKATSEATHYNWPYGEFDRLRGQLGINYNWEGVSAGTTLRSRSDRTQGGATWLGNVSYAGENFNFTAESDLTAITTWSDPGISQLWGNYTFLNGVFFLEASYVANWKGNIFWASDRTGAFRNWSGRGDKVIPMIDQTVLWEDGNTFTMIDGGWENGVDSYIVGDVRLQGLSFGLMIRDIFLFDKEWSLLGNGDVDRTGLTPATTLPVAFVDDVLKKMIFGIKFEMSPIEVAAQFLMENYGVYVGGRWFVGPITVGLSFMGILNEKEVTHINLTTLEKTYEKTDNTKMKVGGGVNYDADSFGAVIKGSFAMLGDKSRAATATDPAQYMSEIAVEPGFYYNVIPSHLKFQLDAGFYFYNYYAGNEKVTDDVSTVQYALQPQLFWNFLGTGAGGYGGTGIALRYRLVGGDADKYNPLGMNNKFDVNFCFSF